mgnify:CR=1 FL=1
MVRSAIFLQPDVWLASQPATGSCSRTDIRSCCDLPFVWQSLLQSDIRAPPGIGTWERTESLDAFYSQLPVQIQQTAYTARTFQKLTER